jgi:hypothetical protein
MVLSTEEHVFISAQRLSERPVEGTNVEEKTTSLHDRRGYMPETSVRFPDRKQVVAFQTLADLQCDLLLRNLCSALIPAFRKFFIDAMLGD